MANMIKFYKGLLASLPTTGDNGAIYITSDEGGIYLGTGTGMKRLGDFIQVDSVSSLPASGASTSALYYCVAENILAKWSNSQWVQINKQKTLADLGGVAQSEYNVKITALETADSDNATAIEELAKYVGTIPTGGTATDIVGYVQEKTTGIATSANLEEIGTRVTTAEGDIDALEGTVDAIMDSADIDSFADVETKLTEKVDRVNGKSLVSDTEITKLAGVSNGANKVEASTANGQIKIDGVETTVYIHPTNHAISEIDGLQTAIDDAKKAGEDAQADIDAFLAAADVGNEAIDTLKEIQDYITSDGTAAKEMTDKISKLETAVGDAKGGLVKDVADNAAAITTEKERAEAAENTLGDRLDALENDTHTHENKALLDTYTQTEADLADAVANKHSHTNADVLDGITTTKVNAWDNAQANAEAYADTAVGKANTELTEAISTKANSADVYTKSQTYTQEEVNKLLTWGSF